MRLVAKLTVQNVRSHDSFGLGVSPSVTVITGENGSGKTSLIEALYLSFRGSSFRGSDKDILRHGQEWWRIDTTLDDGTVRSVKFDPDRSSGKKQFTVNGKTSYRLSENDKLPVVLFEPDDLRLLHGSPARRRLFIDRFASQVDSRYGLSLRRYERALRQRNTLLKAGVGDMDSIFAWNITLSEHGAYIIERRLELIEQINQEIYSGYRVISHDDDLVTVDYSHPLAGDVKTRLLADLEQNLERDRVLGYTTVGPHRHDIIFKLNSKPALAVASRGEVRTIVLALKFIESEIITNTTGVKPVVLLDDVYSELDTSRQQNLSKILSNQIIITSTSDAGVGDKVIKL